LVSRNSLRDLGRLFLHAQHSIRDKLFHAVNSRRPLYGWKHIVARTRYSKILALVSPEEGEFIADIGCAEGRWTYEFKKRGANSFGLDIVSCPALAKRMDIDFIQSDIFQLAFKDSALDKVFISEVLIGLPDIPSALKQVYRVLKPGGSFILLNSRGYQVTDNFFSSNRAHFKKGRWLLAKMAGLQSPNWEELKMVVLRQLGVHYNYERNLQIEEALNQLHEAGFKNVSLHFTINFFVSEIIGLLMIFRIIVSTYRFQRVSFWKFWQLYPLLWMLERISKKPGSGVIYIAQKG
jgi:ubiquinone/menaquinone biosynthesis C-methylase UbiE